MPKVKFTDGDIFAIPLPDQTYAVARVILDVQRQCMKPKLIEDSPILPFFNGAILVDIYRETVSQPEAKISDRLIPGIFIGADRIVAGEWPIVGNNPVDPKEVEFPEFVTSYQMSTWFSRGEVMIKLGEGINGWNGLTVSPSIHSEYILPKTCLFYLDRKDLLAEKDLRNSDLSGRDLRFNPRRSEVYTALGLKEDEQYYDIAQRSGFDTARFYEKSKKGK